MTEIVKVYTKYDFPARVIVVPFVKPIRAEIDFLLWRDDDDLFDYTEYPLSQIEDGLEGVRFFHYRRATE